MNESLEIIKYLLTLFLLFTPFSLFIAFGLFVIYQDRKREKLEIEQSRKAKLN